MIGVFLTGDMAATQVLNRTASMLRTPVDILRQADSVLLDDVQKHFDESGPGWAPLKIQRQVMSSSRAIGSSPGTLMVAGRKPLVNTGKLRLGFAQHLSMQANALERFNLVDYGRVHEYGSEIKNIPARSFTWLSDEAQDKIQALQLLEIDRVIR